MKPVKPSSVFPEQIGLVLRLRKNGLQLELVTETY